jgi:hypothetical protein
VTQLERLAAEFAGRDVKTRRGQGGGPDLTYISIDATIRRLNEVLGADWSTNGTTKVEQLANGSYLATTELHLYATVDGTQTNKYGVGAMVNKDVDMAMKSALAEALKKAGHQLGVALYLWDNEARQRAEARMKLAKNTDSEAALKRAVFDLASQKLGAKPGTAAEVAKVFGRKAGELADKDVLREILEAEGVL